MLSAVSAVSVTALAIWLFFLPLLVAKEGKEREHRAFSSHSSAVITCAYCGIYFLSFLKTIEEGGKPHLNTKWFDATLRYGNVCIEVGLSFYYLKSMFRIFFPLLRCIKCSKRSHPGATISPNRHPPLLFRTLLMIASMFQLPAAGERKWYSSICGNQLKSHFTDPCAVKAFRKTWHMRNKWEWSVWNCNLMDTWINEKCWALKGRLLFEYISRVAIIIMQALYIWRMVTEGYLRDFIISIN